MGNIIPNNTFKMDENGNLIPTGEVTGTIEDAAGSQGLSASPGASGGQQGETGVPGTSPTQVTTPEPAAPAEKQPSPWEKGLTGGYDPASNMTKAAAIDSYNQWAAANGKTPADISEIFSFLKGQDPNKTQTEIEREEKKVKHSEDFEKVGNFLAHLGNFVGTINGSPSQEIEPAANLTKRQQTLRDKTMALRDKSVSDYLATYRQKMADQQASQRAKIEERKQAEREKQNETNRQKAEAYINYQNSQANKNEEQAAYWKTKAECLEKGMSLEEAKKKAETAAANARAAASHAQAEKTKHDDERAAAGKVVEKTDSRGKVTTTTTRPATQKISDNTPPSRRNKNTNNNTPPSRRK